MDREVIYMKTEKEARVMLENLKMLRERAIKIGNLSYADEIDNVMAGIQWMLNESYECSILNNFNQKEAI